MTEKNLEKKINEIQSIVDKLENQDIDIDSAIKLYEKGVKLIKECEGIISVYEEKIRNVLKEEQEDNENE